MTRPGQGADKGSRLAAKRLQAKIAEVEAMIADLQQLKGEMQEHANRLAVEE